MVKKEAQNWLKEKYENEGQKETTETINFSLMIYKGEEEQGTELEGEMLIENFTNLKEISLSGAKGITKLTIKGCSNIETISLYGNPITEVPWLSELKNLRRLNFGNTEIKEIDISENDQLERLSLNENKRKIKIKGLKVFVKKLVLWNSINSMVFPWEQISEEDLREIAKELNIGEEKMNEKSPEQIKELIRGEIKKLQDIKDKIKEIPDLLNEEENKINDDKWNGLKELLEQLKGLGIEKVEDVVKEIKRLRNKNTFLESYIKTELSNEEVILAQIEQR